MRLLLLSSTLVVATRALYGEPQDAGTQSTENLERGFKNVVGELNSMHGFMVSSEQSQLREAQQVKALQAQNAQYHDGTQRLQQQLQRLQQELQQVNLENSNLKNKDAQIGSNYQKLSTASKKLAQQYKVLQSQDGELRQTNQQEVNKVNGLEKEKTGLLSALRKFKGIIAAQGQELDSAISGGETSSEAPERSAPIPSVQAASLPSLTMPDPAPLPALPAAPPSVLSASVAEDPLPAFDTHPAVVAPITAPASNSLTATSGNSMDSSTSTEDQIPDFGPLELGPPPAAPAPVTLSRAPKSSDAGKQKGKKVASQSSSTPQQLSLEKDLNSLSDVRKGDDMSIPGMDPDVSKIAQADDQVLQMARDAGFLPSA